MIVGVPTEIYFYGTLFLLGGAVDILLVTMIFYIYLPVFYELQLTSVYEVCLRKTNIKDPLYYIVDLFLILMQYLEYRFDSNIRGLASLIYAVSIILYIPIVIYTPALLFNQGTKKKYQYYNYNTYVKLPPPPLTKFYEKHVIILLIICKYTCK